MVTSGKLSYLFVAVLWTLCPCFISMSPSFKHFYNKGIFLLFFKALKKCNPQFITKKFWERRVVEIANDYHLSLFIKPFDLEGLAEG